MSAHGGRARAKVISGHAAGQHRQCFDVADVQFELINHAQSGVTFAVRAKSGPVNRPCLFAGHIAPGMGTKLRKLAHAVDALEGVQKSEMRQRSEGI